MVWWHLRPTWKRNLAEEGYTSCPNSATTPDARTDPTVIVRVSSHRMTSIKARRQRRTIMAISYRPVLASGTVRSGVDTSSGIPRRDRRVELTTGRMGSKLTLVKHPGKNTTFYVMRMERTECNRPTWGSVGPAAILGYSLRMCLRRLTWSEWARSARGVGSPAWDLRPLGSLAPRGVLCRWLRARRLGSNLERQESARK